MLQCIYIYIYAVIHKFGVCNINKYINKSKVSVNTFIILQNLTNKYFIFIKYPENKCITTSTKILKGLYDAILKIIISCIWCNRIC